MFDTPIIVRRELVYARFLKNIDCFKQKMLFLVFSLLKILIQMVLDM